MKKNILMFLLGGIFFSVISVYAATQYLASEIEYKDTTVEEALNDLYTVHETYKNLTSNTTVTPESLLNGVTAYNKAGELITGTNNNQYTEEQYLNYGISNYDDGMIAANGMYADKNGCYTSTSVGNATINLGFKPEYLFVVGFSSGTNNRSILTYYNSALSTTKSYRVATSNNALSEFNLGSNNTSGVHIENITNSGFTYYFSQANIKICYSAYNY